MCNTENSFEEDLDHDNMFAEMREQKEMLNLKKIQH
jgi:hypothetical protein